jgi:hypothetical protein
MNTALKVLFCMGLAAVAWRVVRYSTARRLRADDRAVSSSGDRKQYRRAIQRWENEGGQTLVQTARLE